MLRILPRDAFNDANLLKCLGQLTMLIEDALLPELTYEYDGEPFDIQQDEGDGSTYVTNLTVRITETGAIVHLTRPMNSRDIWPLWAPIGDENWRVLDENGILDRDFLAALRGTK